MRKRFFGLLILVATLTESSFADDLDAQGLLAIAKMAGACGIMDEQIHFQTTTKMAGGDEFVSRFWAVEATRLGMSMQQYSDQCNSAISAYERLWKELGQTDQSGTTPK